MADKYNKQLLTEIHKNNHVTLENIVFSNANYQILNYKAPQTIFTNLMPGIYLIVIDKLSYLFNLQDALTGDDKLVVNNIYDAYTNIDGEINKINIYRYAGKAEYENGFYNLPNTVNYYISKIALDGYTKLVLPDGISEQSPYNPAELLSIGSINIITKGNDEDQQDNFVINLKNNIKKLPCGISDLFVMDYENIFAYIIFRIGRMIITGNENWELVNHNDKYSIFFYKYDIMAAGEDNSTITCNYFPSITYNAMMNDSTKQYAISNSNDASNRGIYIRIPVDIVEPDIIEFKKYLRSKFTSDNPIIVEYLLNETKYKSVLLDEYTIKTYFNKTLLSVGYDTTMTCFVKVLGNNTTGENIEMSDDNILEFMMGGIMNG